MSGEELVTLPGGRFRMGSADFYPEEAPVREIEVSAFAIQPGPVTVAQFARFVEETGYVTVAERPVDPADYPDADPSLLVPGSAVFHPTLGPVPL
ncbi:MAG: SUMF1/EgtB/PvdO family nonheme iron enzyme, partial [Solirubrobacterales bacterium]|nr:SUMF1/EgtB/PvdO family nonheme iron enzyme [Solirubrobacterales bacterium]